MIFVDEYRKKQEDPERDPLAIIQYCLSYRLNEINLPFLSVLNAPSS